MRPGLRRLLGERGVFTGRRDGARDLEARLLAGRAHRLHAVAGLLGLAGGHQAFDVLDRVGDGLAEARHPPDRTLDYLRDIGLAPLAAAATAVVRLGRRRRRGPLVVLVMMMVLLVLVRPRSRLRIVRRQVGGAPVPPCGGLRPSRLVQEPRGLRHHPQALQSRRLGDRPFEERLRIAASGQRPPGLVECAHLRDRSRRSARYCFHTSGKEWVP